MATLEFQGRKNPERRAAVEEAVSAERPVRLNTRAGVGGGLNSQPFKFESFTKTVPTYAAQMHADFSVDTLEGLHTGKAGDWLAIGPAGEMYPIDAGVFESSYRAAPAGPALRYRVAIDAAISNIAHVRIGAAVAGLRAVVKLVDEEASND